MFDASGSEQKLVINYLPKVRQVAGHLAASLGQSSAMDDLVQAGVMGLLEAYSRFDPSKGASFDTYAMIRIKGMMLDEIRHQAWAPRSVHRHARKMSQAIQRLQNDLQRQPHDREVAAALAISMDDYEQWRQDHYQGQLAVLEDFSDDKLDPYLSIVLETTLFKVMEEIAGLPKREQQVIQWYYEQGLNLKAIGKRLGITESRVSQIHAQAMSTLRRQVNL